MFYFSKVMLIYSLARKVISNLQLVLLVPSLLPLMLATSPSSFTTVVSMTILPAAQPNLTMVCWLLAMVPLRAKTTGS